MDSLQKISNDLVQSINEKEKKKSIPYDTYAKVIRIDGGTAWVHIPGGVDETPVALTVNANVGDSVLVRVSGGNAWIVGNSSAPPTDDTKAVEAKGVADVAQVKAASAQETAESAEATAASARARASSALEIAEGTNEHFWHDNTGAHVTEVTQEKWNDPDDPNYHAGGNTLITTQGMAIRNGLVNLAEFGATGATIGASGAQIAHLGYGPGTDSGGGTSDAPYYTLGVRTGSVGNYSVAEGYNSEASGYISHAEGESTTASGRESHTEGHNTTASNTTAHAEGNGTTASGSSSHAEGEGTTASGAYCHAEGSYTTAVNFSAHAEGNNTIASSYAHAEGISTSATGYASHTQNQGTKASSNNQTALGKYNVEDNADTYAVIVGNGTADNARSNAFAVDWQGNIDMAGSLQSFFHIVDLEVAVGQVAAHAQSNIGTVTVPTADQPDGMTLVGIVGVACNNYRVVPYNYYVNGTHSITCAVVNTTTAQSAAGTTMTFKLLYAKMASA